MKDELPDFHRGSHLPHKAQNNKNCPIDLAQKKTGFKICITGASQLSCSFCFLTYPLLKLSFGDKQQQHQYQEAFFSLTGNAKERTSYLIIRTMSNCLAAKTINNLFPLLCLHLHTFFNCGMQLLNIQCTDDNAFEIHAQILSFHWIKNEWHFNVVFIIFFIFPE